MEIENDTTNEPEELSWDDVFVIKAVNEKGRTELIGDTCIFCHQQKGCAAFEDNPIYLLDLNNQEVLNSEVIGLLDSESIDRLTTKEILISIGITNWRKVDYDFNIFNLSNEEI